MPSDLSSLGPLTINSTTIAVADLQLSRGIVDLVQMHSGLPYATTVAVPGANPTATFRAYFQDIYALVGFTMLEATTFSMYLSMFTDVTRDSGSTHTKIALTASCMAVVAINSLACDQDGVLFADCSAVFLANASTTHPLTVTTNNALPALTAAAIKHTLGPLVVNGTGRPGVQAASLDLGHNFLIHRNDGDLYPRTAQLPTGAPRLSIGHIDPRSLLEDLGLLGANITADAVQYFRRYDATTGVAGAANGISLTIASGRVHPDGVSAGQGAVATDGITIIPLSSSTTHPVAVSLTATVPAAA